MYFSEKKNICYDTMPIKANSDERWLWTQIKWNLVAANSL